MSRFDTGIHVRFGIYVVDSAGAGKTYTGVPGYQAKWLPGDSELVVNLGGHGRGPFVILNLNTGKIDSLPVTSEHPVFDISPDGKFIYFDSFPTIDSIWSTGIYRYSRADGSVIPLTDGWLPSISSDGRKMAFTRGPVYVMDLIDSTISALTSSTWAEMPTWTADGQYVVYYDRNSNFRIYKSKLSGEREFLTYGDGAMSVSPDGRKLLYNAFQVDSLDLIRLWSLDLNTLETRQFTH